MRDEVEAIHATIMDHLHDVEPGCVSTIVGGYVLRTSWVGRLDIVRQVPSRKAHQ